MSDSKRFGWRYYGQARPPFAITPARGQQSVWDYPRPPRIEPVPGEIVVRSGDVEIARTTRAKRVLETASPPTYYLPPDDVRMELLEPAPGSSYCEWKGVARYWTVSTGSTRLTRAAWSYPDPHPDFEAIRDHVSFYPSLVGCLVDGVRVSPQPGRFYGGWVTPELVGPFKGEPGSEGW